MGVGSTNQPSVESGLVNATTMNGNVNVNININGNTNDPNFMKLQKNHISCWRSQRKPLSWSLICGIMLFALGLISLFTGHVVSDLEYYSQRLIKPHLITKWAASIHEPINIWKSKYMDAYYGCSRRGRHFRSAIPQRFSNGYLLIATSGGLNQQRTGITDAVVVARILNATLVVPSLDHNSYWKDDSDFADIFDVDWFISSLAKDVKIVKRVPDKIMRSMEKPPYTMRVPRKSTPEDYIELVLPILMRRRVVQLYKFDYRLANDLDPELQKLRCRVNYHALRFTKPIQELGSKVVLKMREMAKRFIAVHLRFEPDMLAFSGCYYGGGEKEINELREIRKRWDTLPDLSPLEERKRGKCPLTPEEVGVMLRALGYRNDTYLYVASGEIYGGEATLQPLRELFPNFYTKEILAGEELNSLVPFSSRLAAIDYIVCDESDVFVTNNNGNMAKILAGRRISSNTVPGISAEKYREDNDLWKDRVAYYKKIVPPLPQGRYRNVMDMNAYLGSFAAAMVKYPVWVMNVVPANSNPDTLGVVYERGFIGVYHDWCEAFSSYPRTYDLIHAAGVFSIYQDRCDITYILLEMDRLLRPEGTVIFRDTVEVLVKIQAITKRMKWKSHIADHESGPFNPEKILVAVKTYWTGGDAQQSR